MASLTGNSEVDRVMGDQAGVVSRRQALGCGLQEHDIRRLLRRHEWASVHEGVYVDHTGPPTWLQRAWAAVLYAWPAALCHGSAIRAADGPGRRDRRDDDPIHVAIDRKRTVAAPPGVLVHRLAGLATQTQWNTSPPRIRIEEAVLDVASSAAGELAAVATLADAVQSRRTTADRLLVALSGRQRLARRGLLEGALDDIAHGTCSVLEHAFLTRVERAHGLPTPARQRSPEGQRVLRDADYDRFSLVVELDGRLFHDSATARDADLERDLDARLSEGRETVRLGWGQVLDRPCQTARKLGRLLQARGWTGAPTTCPGCEAPG